MLETKGDQLDNLDIAHKRDVLSFLSGHFAWDSTAPVGQLEVVKNGGEMVNAILILMSERQTNLPACL